MLVPGSSHFLLSSGGWTALAACVTAAIAIIAAIIGGSQLSEARRLRKEQAQPYVTVFLDESGSDPRYTDLVIRNFGTTAATDVRVALSDELHSAALEARGGERPKLPGLIPVLVPGQEWRTFWDFTPLRDEAKLPSTYTATVDFKDSRGKESFRYTFEIDWQSLIDRSFITVYKLHDVAEALRDIRQVLKESRAFGGGLNVYSRDGDAADKRQRKYYEREEQPKRFRRYAARLRQLL